MMNFETCYPDRAFKRQVRQIARALKIREDVAADLAYDAYDTADDPIAPGNIRREALYQYAKTLLNTMRKIDEWRADEREKAAEAAYRARWDD